MTTLEFRASLSEGEIRYIDCQLPFKRDLKKRVKWIHVVTPPATRLATPDTPVTFDVAMRLNDGGTTFDCKFDPIVGNLDWSFGIKKFAHRNDEAQKAPGYELIGKVLAGAVQLWSQFCTGELLDAPVDPDGAIVCRMDFEDDAFPFLAEAV